jgi:mannosyl-3-phosphoglycerate phosphatase
LRQANTVVFCAIDAFVSLRGNAQAGFEEFSDALDNAGIPMVWITDRSRAQLDEPRRRFGQRHPFIAEGGCGVYLPEDYFHLRPAKTVRLGRFTCVPVAEPQPAASEALEALSEKTGVETVNLASLPPGELAQNLNLSRRDADLARQRDFDELFFFAGASQPDVDRFLAEGRHRKLALRQHGVLWSLAVGAKLNRCIQELSKLYDRALHSHAISLGLATEEESSDLLPACDRGVLLTRKPPREGESPMRHPSRTRALPLLAPDVWDRVIAAITSRP